jgi:hypothetical protein
MPWTVDDVERHNKGLSDSKKKRWVAVANDVLERTGDEGRAIATASGVVKEEGEDMSSMHPIFIARHPAVAPVGEGAAPDPDEAEDGKAWVVRWGEGLALGVFRLRSNALEFERSKQESRELDYPARYVDKPEGFRYQDGSLSEGHSSAALYFELAGAQAAAMAAVRASIDPEDLAPDGLEESAHVTLLYGIDDPAALPKLQTLALAEGPPRAEFAGFEVFADRPNYDVLVLALGGEQLLRLREKAEAAVENHQTYSDYRPHATLAYLKKGRAARYASGPPPQMRFTLDRLIFSQAGGHPARIPMYGPGRAGAMFLGRPKARPVST